MVATRAKLLITTLLALGGLLSGCSSDGAGTAQTPGSGLDASQIETEFTRIAPQGYIDLSFKVGNPFDVPIILTGRLVARDANGADLPDVTLTSAFGVERGQLVLMPGGDVDIVRVQGPGAAKVEDVALEDLAIEPTDAEPVTDDVDVERLDKRGEPLEYAMTARAVRLTNPNDVPVRMRVVVLVLRAPVSGVPQGITQTRDVATVEVPAGATEDVQLDAPARKLLRRGLTSFVTLKAVFSP